MIEQIRERVKNFDGTVYEKQLQDMEYLTTAVWEMEKHTEELRNRESAMRLENSYLLSEIDRKEQAGKLLQDNITFAKEKYERVILLQSKEIDRLKAENEVHKNIAEEKYSWKTLMKQLDDVYPSDIFNKEGGEGSKIIGLLREIDRLKAENEAIKESFRPNCAYCKYDVENCDTRNEKGMIIGGHGKAKPYCWEWKGLKGESK